MGQLNDIFLLDLKITKMDFFLSNFSAFFLQLAVNQLLLN